MKNLRIITVTVAACGLMAATRADAQTYGADARTVDSIANGTQQARLFLDSGLTTLAPVNTLIWFVADMGGAPGINTSLTPQDVINIRDGVGDDRLIAARVVDGTLLGAQPGKYQASITGIDTALFADKNIHVYLFNAAGESTTPGAGVTWGELNLGVRTPPGIGNANWFWENNIAADTYIIAVPEPSTYLLSGLGLLGLAAYRRFKN